MHTPWAKNCLQTARPQPELAQGGYSSSGSLGWARHLFDKKYWVAGFNQLNGSNNYGEPRNFMLTVKYTPQL